jgi:lysyl-tRNA synthetase class II
MIDTINEISTKENERNEFVKMCEKYSKEHVERINKCLSLKRNIVSNSRMSEDLKKMFNNELFSDVTFKVENEMIHAHKVINNNNNNNKSQNQSLTMRNCDQSFGVFEDTSHFLFCLFV